MTLVPGDDFLMEIDDIFTLKECQELIKWANEKGWHYPETGGDYLRSIVIDRELSDKLFSQIKHLLPETYNGKRLVYINDHFRFSRYREGGMFPIHEDGTNYDASRVSEYDGYSTESIMTLNIFLNDDFKGGETDFFERGRTKRSEHKLRYRVSPKTGRGALFYAKQLHRGNIVKNGFKYLIRTDVMGI